jgi:hypothetical protein
VVAIHGTLAALRTLAARWAFTPHWPLAALRGIAARWASVTLGAFAAEFAPWWAAIAGRASGREGFALALRGVLTRWSPTAWPSFAFFPGFATWRAAFA